jgi:hypothetical protein
MTGAFIEDMAEFTQDEITNGFKLYRKLNKGMPVPVNIRDEIIKNRNEKIKDKRLKTFSEFNGDWVAYKYYLADKGLLSNNLTI